MSAVIGVAPRNLSEGETIELDGFPLQMGQAVKAGTVLEVSEDGRLRPARPAQSPVEPVLTDRELATQLLAVAALLDHVKAVDTRLRAEAKKRMTVGDRVTGILDPADPKTRIGTVTMAEGSEYVAVKDSAAFFAWVLEEHPDQTEVTTVVRPAFQKAVLDAVKRDGVWNLNPETGAGEVVPGVEVTVGDPKPVVKKNDDAARLVSEAIAAGRLKEIAS